MLKQIFAVIVLFGVLYSVNAIKCYQCKSLTDRDCDRDIIGNSNYSSPSLHIVECNSVPPPNNFEVFLPVTKCNKVVTKDKVGKIVSRDCHFEVAGQSPNECRVPGSNDIARCYVCSGNLCNASSAGRFVALGMMTILTAVTAKLLIF